MTTKSMPFEDPPEGGRLGGSEDPDICYEGYDTDGPVTRLDVQEAADDFLSSLSDLTQTANAYLRERTQSHPYATLGVAAGIGYVLGGGLASRATGLLLTVGGRLLAARLLEDGARRDHEEAERRA